VLTAGEVDTVSDRDARAFLLQRAQDQLRDNEATKQPAILNALPAYIMVLDAAGRVLSVNDTRSKSTTGNPLLGPSYSVGHNYLDKCDHARGTYSSDAQRAAVCIRAALNGAQKWNKRVFCACSSAMKYRASSSDIQPPAMNSKPRN
jgi:hypothetical protein